MEISTVIVEISTVIMEVSTIFMEISIVIIMDLQDIGLADIPIACCIFCAILHAKNCWRKKRKKKDD